MFVPDETALEVLRLVDGARSVDAIVDELAASFDAPREEIAGDVREMLARPRRASGVVRRVTAIAPPLGLLAELTHRCPLRCPYCSNPLELTRGSAELDTADLGARVRRGGRARRACRCTSRAASRPRGATSSSSSPRARAAGLYTNLITAGVLLDAARCSTRWPRRGSTTCSSRSRTPRPPAPTASAAMPARHAAQARGRAGWSREAGLPLTLNAVVHRQNLRQPAAR